MRFLKDNLSQIVRLYINQIGIAIFAMILYTAVNTATKEEGGAQSGNLLLFKILVSVFSTLFYCVLVYTATWELGAKDKIRTDAGRLQPQEARGLLMGLFANLPNFLAAAISTLTIGLHMLGLGEWLKGIFTVINLFMRIFVSPYLGMIQGIFVSFREAGDLYYLLQSAAFIVFPLIGVLASHLGYRMGRHDRRIFSRSNTGRA